MAAPPLTVLFMPESAYGPTNQCIGLGDVLRRRGHRVVFAAEASWRGRLAPLGFEEDLVDLAPPTADGPTAPDEQDAGAFWKDFIRDTAPEFRKPTLEQLETFIQPTWQALIDGARYCEPQLRDIIGRTRPDVIVEDNVVAFPALLTSGAPYVRIVSCNPLEVPRRRHPPGVLRLPGRRPERLGRRSAPSTTGPTATCGRTFNAWVRRAGRPAAARPASSCTTSRAWPTSTSSPRRPTTPTPARSTPTWHRMDSSVRETDEPVRAARRSCSTGRPAAP